MLDSYSLNENSVMNVNKAKINYRSPVQKQKGFVLVLAIVLLTVLTLIGVSSMNSASIELKSAANEQQHQIAFNAVQSVIEYAISNAVTQGAVPLLDYQTNDEALEQVLTYSIANASALSAKLEYTDCAIGVEAFSQQVQGVRHTAASCK